MSTANEASEAIKALVGILNGYMPYDGMVGGIVSGGIKMLTEARELLKNPTEENVQEVLRRVQVCKNNYSPYTSEAPDVMRQIDIVMEKLQTL